MRLDVYHHFPPTDTSTSGKLDQVLAALATLGGKVSQLSDAVDAALTSEADEDARQAAALAAKDAIIAELQSQNSALASDLSTALADDAADQATIDAKQAEIDAQNADIDAQIARLNEAFPSQPVEPPGDGGGGEPGEGEPVVEPNP